MELLCGELKNIDVLEKKLEKAIEEESEISFHSNNNGIITRITFILEDFNVSKEGIYLVGNWTEFDSTTNEKGEIVKIEMETDDSIYILFKDGGELYLEFV